MMSKAQALVVSRRTLTKGQASLYDLTVDKVNRSQAITLDEAVNIWSNQVCRNHIKGVPSGYVWRYDHDREKYINELEPLTEAEIQARSIQWLMQSIGALVMKGYLKVTPMVTLS